MLRLLYKVAVHLLAPMLTLRQSHCKTRPFTFWGACARRPSSSVVKWLQVSLMALQRLLDFGSGYEPALKAATGRGARETMQFGVIG